MGPQAASQVIMMDADLIERRLTHAQMRRRMDRAIDREQCLLVIICIESVHPAFPLTRRMGSIGLYTSTNERTVIAVHAPHSAHCSSTLRPGQWRQCRYWHWPMCGW